MRTFRVWKLPVGFMVVGVLCAPVLAERISNPVAVFVGLDKITGLTTNFEAKIGEKVAFGTLNVLTSVCYSRPITEQPKTVAFVQVDSLEPDGTQRKLFSGWMFAESPGLNAVEHPVSDVWLTGCRDPDAPPPPVEAPKPVEPGPETGPDLQEDEQPLD